VNDTLTGASTPFLTYREDYLTGNNAQTTATATADFNGDGRPDVVVVNLQFSNVSVFLNSPTATIAQATAVGTIIEPPQVTASAISGTENSSVTETATFVDAAASNTHTATVAWGDGKTSAGQIVEPSPQNHFIGSVTGSHVYPRPGTYTVTVTVTGTNSAKGTSTASATIADAAAASLVLTASTAHPVAGVPFSITVYAVDAGGDVTTAYRGTVHFTSSDHLARLPADYTFTSADAGVHTFTGVILTKAGSQGITVTDTRTGSVTGSVTVTVKPGAATHFTLGAPASAVAGAAFSVTITARDLYGNVATGYLGTIHFTSPDPSAVLPADYTFTTADAGMRTFSVVLNTVGIESITAADTAKSSIKGTARVTVRAAGPRAEIGSAWPRVDRALLSALDELFAAGGIDTQEAYWRYADSFQEG
jgi:hypothetical protein